jgi:hypothetical protein
MGTLETQHLSYKIKSLKGVYLQVPITKMEDINGK